jgi:hypothetical protein
LSEVLIIVPELGWVGGERSTVVVWGDQFKLVLPMRHTVKVTGRLSKSLLLDMQTKRSVKCEQEISRFG